MLAPPTAPSAPPSYSRMHTLMSAVLAAAGLSKRAVMHLMRNTGLIRLLMAGQVLAVPSMLFLRVWCCELQA